MKITVYSRLFSAVIALCALAALIFGCQEHIPPSEWPSIRYNNVPLDTKEVLIFDGPADGTALFKTPTELIAEYLEDMPVNNVSDGAVTFFEGKDRDTVFKMEYIGVYGEDGELLLELPQDNSEASKSVSGLPAGRYIICVKTERYYNGGSDTVQSGHYLFARIDKAAG